jgi:hypothetical protein
LIVSLPKSGCVFQPSIIGDKGSCPKKNGYRIAWQGGRKAPLRFWDSLYARKAFGIHSIIQSIQLRPWHPGTREWIDLILLECVSIGW